VGAEAKFVPLIVTTMAEHRHETDIQWDGIILIKNIGSNLPAVRATHGAAWSAIAVRLLLDVYVPTTTQTPGPLLNVIGEVNPAFPTTVSCRGALRAVKGEGGCGFLAWPRRCRNAVAVVFVVVVVAVVVCCGGGGVALRQRHSHCCILPRSAKCTS
jgi:hypothetical protein